MTFARKPVMVIKKGLPLPPLSSNVKYPFYEMKIDDCVDLTQFENPERAYNAAMAYARRHDDMKFIRRGYNLWRVK